MQTAVVKSRVTAAVEDLRLLYGAVEKPTDNLYRGGRLLRSRTPREGRSR